MPSFERLHSLGICLLVAGVLGACSANKPIRPPATPPPEKTGPSPEEIRQSNVTFFLKRAEQALRKGYLTQPAGASAYDYYLRAQQLDPGNRRARAGIQTLVVTYVEQAREALRQRGFGEVETLLKRAEMLAPGNSLVVELRRQLVRERERARFDLPEGESIGLPVAELNARSEQLAGQLQRLARRIRSEQLRVIIVARDDAEGRWIYQQLREAVPGYRVRGDIKVGSPARLLLVQSGGKSP
ncbi:N-acetylglucosaminyltransferase [Microbulbifer spongiae]|uniref:N-acetylglucosaminyltransferase n=1 Tax=Microbulbifer spongiae TaxID=2944933 RepID=A0ABY9E8T7_9GAMM|nr:N-acetylglucosaminyltransferase [Microbulbifer sp. MI-G]WKD49423.1 N-acetylglucosaminyltransferase [Microbulbifer sp. MI-G]